jgi:hypothetical protein
MEGAMLHTVMVICVVAVCAGTTVDVLMLAWRASRGKGVDFLPVAELKAPGSTEMDVFVDR